MPKSIIIFTSFYSCQKKDKQNTEDELGNLGNLFLVTSKKLSGLEYNRVYTKANDSLNNWTKNHLSAYIINQNYGWHLDSLICFNGHVDKCVMALSYRLTKNDNHDGLDYFYGVRINSKWYFFKGPNIMLFRESYGYPKNQPLPFSKLHEIAMKEVFSGYLKKTWNGKWEINEKFFDRIEFQIDRWGYWDSNGKEIINSKLSSDSLQKLYLDRIIYDKYRFQ